MKTLLKTVFLSLLLVGCGTVAPPAISDGAAAYDATTPAQYSPQSSGFLGFVHNERGEVTGCLLTDRAVERYDTLLDKYQKTLLKECAVSVDPRNGLEPVKDKFGNQVWKMDAEHLQYFLRMNRWQKEGKEPVK